VEEEPGPEDLLKAKLLDVEARLRTVSAAYLQVQDEMSSLKERGQRLRGIEQGLMKGEVVRKLFEPLQNLRRCVGALAGSGTENSHQGLEMVIREFLAGFESLGLEEISGEGKVFDPNLHEAISVVPCEADQDGQIMEVFSVGYRVGDTLIEPARVVIGKAEPDSPAEA
jgi:molecular chaperone GrpE